MDSFEEIAARYRQTSLVQASAGAKLIELLDIPARADILDVGCGTGNLTARLAKKTAGKVIGIDPSGAMIREASRIYPDPRIRFLVMDSHEMSFDKAFDVIYCNSVFQWFFQPEIFLGNAVRALRPGGKIGMQAPARHNYCPVFLEAIESCSRIPELNQVISTFRSPWFMLDTAEAYRSLFEEAGFKVIFSTLEETRNRQTPAQVFDIFGSGAKAGYLNPACYDSPFPEGFETLFLDAIHRSFESQADADGMIDLMFYRIYVIAER